MESEEPDAESGEPTEEEWGRQKVAAQFARYGLTPRSLVVFCLSIVFFFIGYFLVLLVEALGILVGLLSLQPLPFLHPIARIGYALMAFLVIGPPLFLWIASLFPHGAVARLFAAAKREHPERFRHQLWKRAVGLSCDLVLTAYLILLVLAPATLIGRWPVWPLPSVVTALVNTAIFLGITALLGGVVWLPRWLWSYLDRRSSTAPQSPTL
ncbi:MAG TPA: hypothetical protein VH393_11890 [Ktedonobacterales bacterium]